MRILVTVQHVGQVIWAGDTMVNESFNQSYIYNLLTLLTGCGRRLTSCIHRIQMRTRLHKEIQNERHFTLTILGTVDLRYQYVQRCVACRIDSNYRSSAVHQYQCGGIAGKSKKISNKDRD